VPFNVRSRVESGHIDSVNEVRVCTVVFLGFPTLNTLNKSPAESLAVVQSVTQAAQGRMHQDGGFFLQMRCDEKGYLALCAFGLPGRSHEDSPARGVQAALAVVSNLQRQGFAAVAGVTTGNLFCGVVGSSRRAEYTVFGDAINFAARLMVRASKNPELGPVLCDEPTRWMAAMFAYYTALDPVPVKGRAQPMKAFKVSPRGQWTVTGMTDVIIDASPVLPRFLTAAKKERQRNEFQKQKEEEQRRISTEKGGASGLSSLPQKSMSPSTTTVAMKEAAVQNHGLLLQATQEAVINKNPAYTADIAKYRDSVERHLQSTTNSFAPLVGRENELAAAGSRLADLVDGRGGGAVFVEGGTGVGKSRLIEEIAWGEGLAPLRQRCMVIASAGLAMRQSEPLNPWRRVFRMIFNADIERSAERRALAGTQVTFPFNTTSAFSREGGIASSGGEVASDLAIRLAQHVPDYAVWRPVIASALGMRVEELPVALAGAARRSSAARQAGLFAVDDVSVLLKARAHTFNHVSGWDLSAIDETITQDAAAGTAAHEERGATLERPGSDSSVGAHRVQYAGRSVSARNLDPGRPLSSASNQSRASTAQGGGGGGGGGGSNNYDNVGGGTRPALPPAEMSPQLRALKMRGLLVALIREFVAAHASLFIVFDDVHLFDGPSWRLLLAMLASCQKDVLFMCTLRPVLPLPSAEQTPSLPLGLDAPRNSSKSHFPLPTPGEFQTTPIGPKSLSYVVAPGGLGADEVFSRKLGEYYEEALWRDGSERITLKNFSLDETSRFISESLDGLEVPWAAAQLLYDKSAGMPAYLHQMCLFFKIRAQEIARGKPSSGTAPSTISAAAIAAAAGIPSDVLSTDASMVEVARVGMDFVRATVTVHSIVPARVDRLRPDEQLTLKVASVMGATVYTDLLQAAHPKNPSMRRLQANLQALAAAGFLTKQIDTSSGGFGSGGGVSRQSMIRPSRNGPRTTPNNSNNATWQFTDVLARDVVWDMIPLTQRREWQARLATAMARCGNARGGGIDGGNSDNRRPIPPAIIAYHWSQAAIGVERTEVRIEGKLVLVQNKNLIFF
jgi:Adenylate and Guanylate cyclase catalytic domain